MNYRPIAKIIINNDEDNAIFCYSESEAHQRFGSYLKSGVQAELKIINYED